MNQATRCVVAMVAFLLCFAGSVSAQELFSPTQSPIAGSRVFRIKGCIQCHAVNGVGGQIGPDLGRIPRPRSFYDLGAAMWNHLPRMAERMREFRISRPHLYSQETANLIAFLYTLNYFDPPGNVEAGQRLFVEKRCVVCHQVGGTGGVVGPNLDFLKQYGSPIFVATAMWNHGPAMAEAMQARGITRPTFKGSELNDLIAYVKSASPAPSEESLYILPGSAEEGRRLFVEKDCRVCHSVGGKGGRVGPDLSERGVHRSLTEFAAVMWNKAPGMINAMRGGGIPVPQLEPQEMADLVAYLYSVRYFAEPGDAGRGEKVVQAKGCLSCHSIRGKGGKSAGDLARSKRVPTPVDVVSVMWNHALGMQEQTETEQRTWPQFRSEEIADLVAYLQTLRQNQ